jgi:hypothetical protein
VSQSTSASVDHVLHRLTGRQVRLGEAAVEHEVPPGRVGEPPIGDRDFDGGGTLHGAADVAGETARPAARLRVWRTTWATDSRSDATSIGPTGSPPSTASGADSNIVAVVLAALVHH